MTDLWMLLISLTISGSLLALLVAGIRSQFRKQFPKSFFYYLWLIVLFRFLCPVGTQQSLSHQIITQPMQQWVIAGDLDRDLSDAAEDPIQITPVQPRIWKKTAVMAHLWLLGFCITWGNRQWNCLRLTRALARSEREVAEWERVLYEELTDTWFDKPQLKRSAVADGPVLIGLVHPTIYLPTTEMEENDLRYALAHELVHWKRRDLWYKQLVVFVTSLHWFNPVVWLVAGAVEKDCELSCDQRVVRHMSDDQRSRYGMLLLQTAYHQRKSPIQLSAPFGSQKKCLKERIETIMDVRKTTKLTRAVLLIVTMAVAASFVAVGAYAGESCIEKTTEGTVVPGESMSSANTCKADPRELSWPFKESGEIRLSALFGHGRIHPVTGQRTDHNGIDIVLEKDTPVLAAADGIVTETGYNSKDGNYVLLTHGGGLTTRYTHLASSDTVKTDDSILAGEQIGVVGKTGKSTGYHLHFETVLDGIPTDPMDYFPSARVTHGPIQE